MNQKKFEKWEKTRAKGKLRFVLIFGIIRIGFPLSIIKVIIKYFRHPTNNIILQFDIVDLVVYSIGGCFLGLVTWKIYEKKYLLKKNEITETKSEEVLNNKEESKSNVE